MTSPVNYRFNPPMHPELRHRVPDLGKTTTGANAGVISYLYNESSTKPNASDPTGFGNLRLGRIVTSARAAASVDSRGRGYKWGFRFLYNPNQVTGGLSVGTGFIPDPSDIVPAVLQEGLETIHFEVLLNRQPDVMGAVVPADYMPGISNQDLGEIKERGTHYDLEFLYRVANGINNTNSRSGTGDIGILMPTPCELYLGPFRSRGAIVGVSATDKMFSPNMVPILTTVQINFGRFLNMAQSGTNDNNTALVSHSVQQASYTVQVDTASSAGAKPVVQIAGATSVSELLSGLMEASPLASFFGWSVVQDAIAKMDEELASEGGGSSGGGGSGEEQPPSSGESIDANSGTSMTGKQVYDLMIKQGFPTDAANLGTRVAYYESGWNPRNYNGTGQDRSYGLFQINMYGSNYDWRMKKYNLKTPDQLFDPVTNVWVAHDIWKSAGNTFKGNWSVYNKAVSSTLKW